MASKKNNRAPCGHPMVNTCATCAACITCKSNDADRISSSNAEINRLGLALGQSAQREEQLRRVLSQGPHNPIERGERDLAFARIALIRRKMDVFLAQDSVRTDKEWRDELQAMMSYDDTTRTLAIEDVVAEASSIRSPPPSKKRPVDTSIEVVEVAVETTRETSGHDGNCG